MQDTMLRRCFYAIRIGSKITDVLQQTLTDMQGYNADVRWTPLGHMHITLRFLGELTPEQVEQARFHPSAKARIGGGTFSIRAEGLGAFPTLRAPSILWAGVATENQDARTALLELQAATELWAQQAGLPPEHRRFRPHITLGRVRTPAGVKPLIDYVMTAECITPFTTVTELLFMESTLTPDGAQYAVVDSWQL